MKTNTKKIITVTSPKIPHFKSTFYMLPIPKVIICADPDGENENEGFPQPLDELSQRELTVIANKWKRELLNKYKPKK